MSESDGEQAARSLALEQAYVHDVYEQCADRTVQGKHWPLIHEFLEELEPGALVCDVGCGNGKYLDVNYNVFKIGVDRCQRFARIARERKNEVLICDNLVLPFRDESFDAVLSIAVVHHFSTTDRRVRALKELARVLRIGGRLVISVWAMEQKHRKFESQDVLVPWPKAYCVNSSGCPIKPRGMSYNDRHRGKSAQTHLLSKRSSQRTGSNGKSYWIDPIFSPSPSTSSLSSPNETCYSFFRRALQKLAGGRRGSRAWFLENWQRSGVRERHPCEDEDDGDVEDLPIELRRLEDGAVHGERRSQHAENHGVKSKSLGDILEAQRLDLVRSRSSVPGLCNAGDEAQQPPKPRLVKQKSHLLDDACIDAPNDTAINSIPKGVPNFQVAPSRRDNLVQKQSSMNEELMFIERLKERESTHRNIMKQTSLNEELICKDRPAFEVFKDTLYSGSATKRFQLLKNGLTSRIRQSTTNIEKVSGMSIRNGFVRILQSWTSTESPVTATTPTVATTTTTTAVAALPRGREVGDPSERRSSREDGSDSSKDGSLQSDTSVDSEDSFASVIYVPKKSPSPLREGPLAKVPGYHATSAPPSPRLKYAPELGGAHRLKLIPVTALLKQFPATSKSLPPPSPPGLSPRILGSASTRPFFSGPEPATTEPATTEPQPMPVVAVEEPPVAEPNACTKEELPKTPKEAKAPSASDNEESRLLGLRQIKELLRQKPGFAARTRPSYPLVRRASGPEPAEKLLPRLLEVDLFNPETDDLDSDSSGASSPESMGSVISVLGEVVKGQEATSVRTMDRKSAALDKRISPVESTWNEECNRHLIDLTDRLSENLIHDIDQFCKKTKLELAGDDVEAADDPTTARCLVDRERVGSRPQPLQRHEEIEVGRSPSLGRRSGDLVESSDSAATSEGSQPESSGPRRPSTSWSPRPRLCPQTRSASEESRPQCQAPGSRIRRQQQPSTSNGTLSGSSSQESLPSDQITHHQFYHVFREGELDQLIGKYVENLHVISSYYEHASWCVVAEKVQVWTI